LLTSNKINNFFLFVISAIETGAFSNVRKIKDFPRAAGGGGK